MKTNKQIEFFLIIRIECLSVDDEDNIENEEQYLHLTTGIEETKKFKHILYQKNGYFVICINMNADILEDIITIS